jgi:hypothetical protein
VVLLGVRTDRAESRPPVGSSFFWTDLGGGIEGIALTLLLCPSGVDQRGDQATLCGRQLSQSKDAMLAPARAGTKAPTLGVT